MIIKVLEESEFESFFNDLMPKAFADRFAYSIMQVRTERELQNFKELKDAFSGRESYYLGAYTDDGKLMGWSASYQGKVYELYTKNSVVLPEYRRMGVYSELTRAVLKHAEERGFQMVCSHHNASNNSVIIAKMKLGFYITGCEVSDDFGTLVKMTKYLNPAREKAFHVRTGHERPDLEMKELLRIT
ncbi:MAG: GNAT family N-acetyltransferase [Bdellovibrionota bacterium]